MLLTTLALAASLQFDCPATIETRQQLLTPQQGWQAFTRDDDGKPDETLSHRLDNLALFDGDPAELAQLIQDVTEQMHQAATDLHFELAARLRDEVRELKKELRQMRSATA